MREKGLDVYFRNMIGSLPSTADGVFMYPGLRVWYWSEDARIFGKTHLYGVKVGSVPLFYGDVPDDVKECKVPVFSREELAKGWRREQLEAELADL